jgi:hypothetical protein
MTIAFGRRSKPSYVNSHISPLKSPSQAYEAWQCKNQLVISWLFYSMKNRIAEIFSYLELSLKVWEAVKEMYRNQNNIV